VSVTLTGNVLSNISTLCEVWTM